MSLENTGLVRNNKLTNCGDALLRNILQDAQSQERWVRIFDLTKEEVVNFMIFCKGRLEEKIKESQKTLCPDKL